MERAGLATLGRHQLAGLAATVVDYGSFVVLVELVHLWPEVATADRRRAGGAVTNFTLSRHLVFRGFGRIRRLARGQMIALRPGLLREPPAQHAGRLSSSTVWPRVAPAGVSSRDGRHRQPGVELSASSQLRLSASGGKPLRNRRPPHERDPEEHRDEHPSSTPTNQSVHLQTIVPGPKSRALRDREEAHMAPGLQGYAVMAGIVAEHAEGSAITDVDGNTVPRLHRRHRGQRARSLAPRHREGDRGAGDRRSRSARSPPSHASISVERVAKHALKDGEGNPLHRVQLYSSGAEAVESALRLAKSHTGKYEFVSFWGGFHGKTMGTLSLMGSTAKERLGPMLPGSHFIPYADCYRCPLNLEAEELRPGLRRARTQAAEGRERRRHRRHDRRADARHRRQHHPAGRLPPRRPRASPRRTTRSSSPTRCSPASVVPESTGGAITPGVTPDIVTVGKAFGGGFPLSGVLVSDGGRAGQAVVGPERLVVVVRRQRARFGRWRRLAPHHRGRRSGRELARRRRLSPRPAATVRG